MRPQTVAPTGRQEAVEKVGLGAEEKAVAVVVARAKT